MTVRVGTSGYNYPEWKGTFHPADLPASKMLAYYVERFRTVEINATFYRMPTAKTLAAWRDAAPDGFTFVLKAPQRITHMARLRDVCAKLPPDLRAAFEFRHGSWFDEEVYALLRAKNAALCIAETEDGATPSVPTADWGYLRLRAVEYSDDDLARWIATIQRLGAGWRDAFVFFKHEDAGTGPA